MNESHNATLIVAHAQHPLVDGRYPGEEFAARLDSAAQIYEGNRREAVIYVPGSRHRVGAYEDEISLAEAGLQYLKEHGVSRVAVHGTDWNEHFKGKQGVYNAGDEVYVAAQAYKEFAFSSLSAVCSIRQQQRLGLHYRAYGLNPDFHSPNLQADSHDDLSERMLTAYTHINSTWQRGLLPRLIRKTRLPKD